MLIVRESISFTRNDDPRVSLGVDDDSKINYKPDIDESNFERGDNIRKNLGVGSYRDDLEEIVNIAGFSSGETKREHRFSHLKWGKNHVSIIKGELYIDTSEIYIKLGLNNQDFIEMISSTSFNSNQNQEYFKINGSYTSIPGPRGDRKFNYAEIAGSGSLIADVMNHYIKITEN